MQQLGTHRSITVRSSGAPSAGRGGIASFTFVLLAMLALAAGCSKRSEPKITGSSSAPPVSLQCLWQPGYTYHLRLEMSQITDLEKPEANDASQHLVLCEQECLIKVTSGARGALVLDMEILSLAMERAKSGQRALSFDSTHDAEWIDESGYIPVMKKLVGGHLKFQVSSNGNVLRADGISPWLDAALRERTAMMAAADLASGNPSASKKTTIRTVRTTNGVVTTTNISSSGNIGPVASTLRSFFTQDHFKQMLEFPFLPPNPVRVGDRWTTAGDTPISTRGRHRFTAAAKFDGWQMHASTNCARVSVEGKLANAYLPPGRKAGAQDNSLKATVWISRDAAFPAGMVLDKEIWTAPSSNNSPSGTNQITAANPPKNVRQRVTTRLLSVQPAEAVTAAQ
jgi:hypothetical protein